MAETDLSRRAMIRGTAAALPVAAMAASPALAATADAELLGGDPTLVSIALFKRTRDEVNTCHRDLDDDDPLWIAYEAAADGLRRKAPTTLGGLLALLAFLRADQLGAQNVCCEPDEWAETLATIRDSVKLVAGSAAQS